MSSESKASRINESTYRVAQAGYNIFSLYFNIRANQKQWPTLPRDTEPYGRGGRMGHQPRWGSVESQEERVPPQSHKRGRKKLKRILSAIQFPSWPFHTAPLNLVHWGEKEGNGWGREGWVERKQAKQPLLHLSWKASTDSWWRGRG